MSDITKNTTTHHGFRLEQRRESLRIEKIANIFRASVAVIGVVTAFLVRASVPQRSVISIYICAAILVIHAAVLAIIFPRITSVNKVGFRIMQFISLTIDIFVVSMGLWLFGEFRTFKSHVFQMYFLFIALAALRYSRPLTVFAAIATATAYTGMFVFSVITDRIVLGNLSAEYTGAFISTTGIAIKAIFLILVSIVLSSITKGYSNVIRRVVKSERESEQQQQQALMRYFTKDVAEYILSHGGSLASEKRKVTVMFCDFRGFTQISNRLPTERVVSILNLYLSDMVDVIFKHNGTLDKYTGDGFMAVFGAPISRGNDVHNALSAAIELQQCVVKLNEKHKDIVPSDLSIGIGISSGDAIAGNIGSKQRAEYTVIGEPVNLASRLERMNKRLNTTVLFSGATYELVKDSVHAKSHGLFSIRGIDDPVRIFELIEFPMNTPSIS